jgi:DNA modification methylase
MKKEDKKYQKVEQAKGRPMLQWVGKRPLESVQFFPAQEKEVYGDKDSKDFNKLFWGDNLQVLSHLIKEYRGEVDLIYIDPPFDSKADYVKKVKVRGQKVDGLGQGTFEEKQYTDIWEKDEYLQFMYERLLLMRELLSDTGLIYVHCDWHKNSHLRLILDEVFGEANFRNEISWQYTGSLPPKNDFGRKHDTILRYSKTDKYTYNVQFTEYNEATLRRFDQEDEMGRFKITYRDGKEYKTYAKEGKNLDDNWDIPIVMKTSHESSDYPTQKPEDLLEKVLLSSSNEGDLVMDCFVGSGTTCAVAQKLGRKWIGCDINLGAIQTSTKRTSKVLEEQQKEGIEDFKGSLGFKVLNVNDYDVFKNELEAREIIKQMYGVEDVKRPYFDGMLDNNYVKVMPLNRVLNKMDIRSVIKKIDEQTDSLFNAKKSSKKDDAVYEEAVLVIASGIELGIEDFIKKENNTGVQIEVRDILTDKKNLIFKKKPEADIDVKTKDKKLTVTMKDFYSPILMRKLELENEKALKKESKAKVEDFKQIIDSVVIDTDYNGKLFSANQDMMDLPSKKEIIKGSYEWEYPKKGKYTVAVKVVDVLGEEYFETFEITV